MIKIEVTDAEYLKAVARGFLAMKQDMDSIAASVHLNAIAERMPRETAGSPSELEMHRADYQAAKDAGFESPGEVLAAYKTMSSMLVARDQKISELRECIAEYRRVMDALPQCPGNQNEIAHAIDWINEKRRVSYSVAGYVAIHSDRIYATPGLGNHQTVYFRDGGGK